ncbi:prepilin-type N-terminal cleavage/methylation domain-containing protein [Marinobacterium sp. D7]|uniref:prepilin-type N-terminal cleavage/methylation domain-containing protein n=1 Tax=Marinobacterium ramblicola TaxID=2849041 RepID=UPI001C2CE1AD|nr:prepilin-type N-terminal cleavage/methylation domain-containing protein [Marinobacterium ramblicola]MBV1786689.1 prepilin-type N-terminal cleavage/methylation domain-containing protein [Marinobacterium ramblicola]
MLSTHSDSRYPKAGGFTLIEVLVALVVLMVGLAALLQLQSSFIQGATESEKRAVGMALAEKRLEQFRDYQNIAEFNQIGSAAFPTSEVQAVSVGNSSINYTLDWSGITTVSSAINASEYKEITLTVSWDGGASSLAVSTILARVDPNVSPLLGLTGYGGDTPEVSHAAGSVPDVIPIDIGNGKTKETSKPLPDVDQSNESTEVRFETVTYDSTTTKLVQEEFVTVNCFCQLDTGTTNVMETPHHYKYEDGVLVVDKGITYTAGGGVNDTTGTVYGSGSFTQSQYCDRCCAGHHDAADTSIYSANDVPGFKETSPSSPHVHYEVNTVTGVLTGDVAGDGDIYAEACRFRRVDGLFELFPDWKLIQLTAFPYTYASDTASSSLAAYQQYVTERVQNEVFVPLGGNAASASLPSTDLEVLPDTLTQLLARGIYYDDMSYDPNWSAEVAGIVASSATISTTDWLSYTPFFEINMTLLAEWSSLDDTIADVSDEDVNTVADAVANYYGVYSRGLVEATGVASEATSVIATSKTDNTGILGNRYGLNSSFTGVDNGIIYPATATVSSAVAVSILGGGSTVIVSGTVVEDNTGGNVTVAENKTTVSASSGTCTYAVTGGVGAFNCTVAQNAGNVIITVNTSQNNQYIDPDVSVGGNIVAITPGNPASSTDGNITVNVGSTGFSGVNFAARHD